MTTFSGTGFYLVPTDITPGWYQCDGPVSEGGLWQRRSVTGEVLEDSNSTWRAPYEGANAYSHLSVSFGSGDAEYTLRRGDRYAVLAWNASLESVADSITSLIIGLDPITPFDPFNPDWEFTDEQIVEVVGTPGSFYRVEYVGLLGRQRFDPQISLWNYEGGAAGYSVFWHKYYSGADPRGEYYSQYLVEILPTDHAFFTTGLDTFTLLADAPLATYVRTPQDTWEHVRQYPIRFHKRLSRLRAEPDPWYPNPGHMEPIYYPRRAVWGIQTLTKPGKTTVRVKMPDGLWHDVGAFNYHPRDFNEEHTRSLSLTLHRRNIAELNFWWIYGSTGLGGGDDPTMQERALSDSYLHYGGWYLSGDTRVTRIVGSGWGVNPDGSTDERWLAYGYLLLNFARPKWAIENLFPAGSEAYLQFTTTQHVADRFTWNGAEVTGHDAQYTGAVLELRNSLVPFAESSDPNSEPYVEVTGDGTTGSHLASIPLDDWVYGGSIVTRTWWLPLDVASGGTMGIKFLADPVLSGMVPNGSYGTIGCDLENFQYILRLPDEDPVDGVTVL